MGTSKQQWRDEAVSEVAARWLEDREVPAPVLVVDDVPGQVEALCADRGLEWARWRRFRRHGVEPAAWPPEGRVASAVVRLPKGREALEMTLHAVGSRLRPDGIVWLVGANDEGIKPALDRADAVFARGEAVDARRHCRVLELREPRPGLRCALEDWATPHSAELPDGPLEWVSFPGLFAHGRLDEGTRELLGVLPELPAGARVLDFACGAGLVAAVLLRRNPGAIVDLLDVDALALEAARRNVSGAARIVASDAWEALDPAERYDVVVSNPPLHTGKGSDERVLRQLVEEAPARLRPGGALLLVTQRQVPLREPLEERFSRVEIVRDARGYRVWSAARPR